MLKTDGWRLALCLTLALCACKDSSVDVITPADSGSQVLSSMHQALPGYIASALAENQGNLPRNPQIASYIQAKIDLLQRPTLATDIMTGRFNAAVSARSSDGRLIPIVTVFALAGMRTEAARNVATLERALSILENFLAIPFPRSDVRMWYGFIIGNSGGGGTLYMEDQTTYEIRTPATRLPYEAITCHELSHSYIAHESLNQFLELYVYNLDRTNSAALTSWVFTRGYTPMATTNQGVHALLDVYRLIGRDAMARAYRVVYALRPPYGVVLSAEVRQAFVDQAATAQQDQVRDLMAKVTF